MKLRSFFCAKCTNPPVCYGRIWTKYRCSVLLFFGDRAPSEQKTRLRRKRNAHYPFANGDDRRQIICLRLRHSALAGTVPVLFCRICRIGCKARGCGMGGVGSKSHRHVTVPVPISRIAWIGCKACIGCIGLIGGKTCIGCIGLIGGKACSCGMGRAGKCGAGVESLRCGPAGVRIHLRTVRLCSAISRPSLSGEAYLSIIPGSLLNLFMSIL